MVTPYNWLPKGHYWLSSDHRMHIWVPCRHHTLKGFMCACFSPVVPGSRQTPCLFLSINLISNPWIQSLKCTSPVVYLFLSLVPLYPPTTVISFPNQPLQKLQIVPPLLHLPVSLILSSPFPTEPQEDTLYVLIISLLCLKFPLTSSWIRTCLLVSCYMRPGMIYLQRLLVPSHFLTSTWSTLRWGHLFCQVWALPNPACFKAFALVVPFA